MPIVWDLITSECQQLLCTIQFERYKVLPDVVPIVEKRVQPVEEEVDKALVREMTQKPHPESGDWRK